MISDKNVSWKGSVPMFKSFSFKSHSLTNLMFPVLEKDHVKLKFHGSPGYITERIVQSGALEYCHWFKRTPSLWDALCLRYSNKDRFVHLFHTNWTISVRLNNYLVWTIAKTEKQCKDFSEYLSAKLSRNKILASLKFDGDKVKESYRVTNYLHSLALKGSQSQDPLCKFSLLTLYDSSEYRDSFISFLSKSLTVEKPDFFMSLVLKTAFQNDITLGDSICPDFINDSRYNHYIPVDYSVVECLNKERFVEYQDEKAMDLNQLSRLSFFNSLENFILSVETNLTSCLKNGVLTMLRVFSNIIIPLDFDGHLFSDSGFSIYSASLSSCPYCNYEYDQKQIMDHSWVKSRWVYKTYHYNFAKHPFTRVRMYFIDHPPEIFVKEFFNAARQMILKQVNQKLKNECDPLIEVTPIISIYECTRIVHPHIDFDFPHMLKDDKRRISSYGHYKLMISRGIDRIRSRLNAMKYDTVGLEVLPTFVLLNKSPSHKYPHLSNNSFLIPFFIFASRANHKTLMAFLNTVCVQKNIANPSINVFLKICQFRPELLFLTFHDIKIKKLDYIEYNQPLALE